MANAATLSRKCMAGLMACSAMPAPSWATAMMRRLLVIIGRFQQQPFGEWSRQELEPERHAVGEETARHADRREGEAGGEPPVGARRRDRHHGGGVVVGGVEQHV